MSEFEDPALKAALRRVYAPQRAPTALRRHVRRALEEIAPLSRFNAMRLVRSPVLGLAVAAMLLIVVGAFAYEYFRPVSQARRVANVVHVNLPAKIAEALVARHDLCARTADHNALGGIAQSDFAAISDALTDKLGFTPLVTVPNGGWTFRGASACEIRGAQAAHLLFTRGKQSLSIFSVPVRAIAYSPPEHAVYELTVANHPIAGFVRGGVLNIFVGSFDGDSLPLKDLTVLSARLRDRTTVVRARNDGQTPTEDTH
ncbi:MAG: hypothetical protein ACREJC_20935 [Tepidisphaeraceae bacterium]